MSFFPCPDPVLGDKTTVDSIETLVIPRTSDIGGLEVRRALPTARRRLVGPFIFLTEWGQRFCVMAMRLMFARIHISAFRP